jgi:uncharacterized coiled-coil protein SlyX
VSKQESTAELLVALMRDRDYSINGLAGLLAGGGDHRGKEAWRRAVYRYLNGSDPEPDKAERMEAVLSLPAGYFPRFQRGRHEDGQTLGERLTALETRQRSFERHQGELATAAENLAQAQERVIDRLERLARRFEELEQRIASQG